jgi:hypothetical protein
VVAAHRARGKSKHLRSKHNPLPYFGVFWAGYAMSMRLCFLCRLDCTYYFTLLRTSFLHGALSADKDQSGRSGLSDSDRRTASSRQPPLTAQNPS